MQTRRNRCARLLKIAADVASGQQRTAKLPDDQQLLRTKHDGRKTEYQRVGDDKFVLAELVVPPPSRGQVQRAVDLGDDRSAVRSQPRRVQVSPPAGGVLAHCLTNRGRQPVASAQTDEVDLAQRLGPSGDVDNRGAQLGSVPHPRETFERFPQVGGGELALLHRGGEQTACRPRRAEGAGGPHQGVWKDLDRTVPHPADRGPAMQVQPYGDRTASSKPSTGRCQQMDRFAVPALETDQGGRCESGEDSARSRVDLGDSAYLIDAERSVVQNDSEPVASPTTRRDLVRDLRTGEPVGQESAGGRDEVARTPAIVHSHGTVGHDHSASVADQVESRGWRDELWITPLRDLVQTRRNRAARLHKIAE